MGWTIQSAFPIDYDDKRVLKLELDTVWLLSFPVESGFQFWFSCALN